MSVGYWLWFCGCIDLRCCTPCLKGTYFISNVKLHIAFNSIDVSSDCFLYEVNYGADRCLCHVRPVQNFCTFLCVYLYVVHAVKVY
jgi:hypothetical protein